MNVHCLIMLATPGGLPAISKENDHEEARRVHNRPAGRGDGYRGNPWQQAAQNPGTESPKKRVSKKRK